MPEAKRSLVNTLSKICAIKVLTQGRQDVDAPSLCLGYEPAIQLLSSLIREFKGRFTWVMMGDLSHLCIVPLENLAIQKVTLNDASRTEAARLEMGYLAAFIEAKLNLQNSNGHDRNN